MSQRNECVDRVVDELERYGLRAEVSHRSKHIEIAWNTPFGRRFVIAPATASDWRSSLNTRGEVRKLLKADNMQPQRISEASFQKAMSLPKEKPTYDQELRNDLDAMMDLILELQSQLIDLQTKMSSIRVVSRIEFGDVVQPYIEPVIHRRQVVNAEGPYRQGSKFNVVYAVMTEQYKTIQELVGLTGISDKHIGTILWKMKKQGHVESGLRGEWRRK